MSLNVLLTCENGCSRKAPPHRANGRGHDTEEVTSMREQPTCACGCGGVPTVGKRYLLGHHGTRDPWDRFWRKVVESADRSPNGWTGCWIWTGSINAYGYGRMSIGPRGRKRIIHPAHRLAYEWIIGKVPEGLVLDHLCRNRCCVNPAHLEPVTTRENLLRGEGWSGRHARKTHCPAGHPLEGVNLSQYHLKHGQRKCLTCHRLRERARKERLYGHRDRDVALDRVLKAYEGANVIPLRAIRDETA